MSAGNLRSESDLHARSGNVDPCGELASNAPHACGDFVPEDHARGDAVRFLSSRNAKVRAAQGCCFDGEENIAWAECWDGAFVEYQGTGGAKRRCEHGFHAPSIGLVPSWEGRRSPPLYAPTYIPTITTIEHMFYIMAG